MPDAPELRLQAARRAVELDPEYADAWQMIGRTLSETDPQAALAAIDHCTTITPMAADCWVERAFIENVLGQCASAEAHLRRGAPHSAGPMKGRVMMLYALGKPGEAVAEALREHWALLDPGIAPPKELEDRAVLAAAYGDFEAARTHAAEGLRLIDSQPNLQRHAVFTALLADIELEAGRGQAARPVIEDFLRRREGWRLGTSAEDPTVYLTRVLARIGALPEAEVRARRDAWYRAASSDAAVLKARAWAAAYARGIERESEAVEALAARPGDASWPIYNEDWLAADLGRALWLGGKRDEALPHLEQAFKRCDRFLHVFHQMRTDLLFGRALEERGDRGRACEVYGSILARWGKARPRSVTADEARARARALGCDAPP